MASGIIEELCLHATAYLAANDAYQQARRALTRHLDREPRAPDAFTTSRQYDAFEEARESWVQQGRDLRASETAARMDLARAAQRLREAITVHGVPFQVPVNGRIYQVSAHDGWGATQLVCEEAP